MSALGLSSSIPDWVYPNSIYLHGQVTILCLQPSLQEQFDTMDVPMAKSQMYRNGLLSTLSMPHVMCSHSKRNVTFDLCILMVQA